MTDRQSRAPWIGVAVALSLLVLAMLVPVVTGQNVYVRWFPPLHAEWLPRVGPGTIPALLLGSLAIAFAPRAAEVVRWRWLLVGSFVLALAWMLSLATVDGLDGIGHILDTQYEYLRTARGVTDIGATFDEYVSRIPLDSPDNWPVHIAGHPAGALLFFVGLVKLGLGSGLAAGLSVIVIAATTPVAVLLTLRRLATEELARRAAPFLVVGPAAIWMAVSADAVFGAVAAWGLCCLAVAATSSRRLVVVGFSVAAGLLLGYCVMLSYGLPLLGVLAVAILAISRSWLPLPIAAVAAVAVVVAFAAAGFAWWEAYPVLVERYWDGIASSRPYWYWIWGNLAALVFSAGPLVGASVAVALRDARPLRSLLTRPVVVLALAALATVALADLSGMSKAEVERIWLPFVPWLLVATGLLDERWRRLGFAAQVVFAIVVQHLLLTGW